MKSLFSRPSPALGVPKVCVELPDAANFSAIGLVPGV